MFYSLLLADSDADTRPVFVFFNGGPGYATTGFLQAHGTGPFTLDADASAPTLESNPSSWSRIGSLLYIDARQTGFSYSTLDDPSDDDARAAEFEERNFNPELDAADFVRVVLRVLDRHPTLRDNPVVLVGESYGGFRATLMLEYLLYPRRLRDSTYIYVDGTLADEIERHYAAVFPNGTALDAATGARQFGWQVLIQPHLGYTQDDHEASLWCQPGTPEAEIAEASGESCPPASRDLGHLGKPDGWSAELSEQGRQAVLSRDSLEQLLRTDPGLIDGLAASERVGAFRCGAQPFAPRDSPTPPEWLSSQGQLADWDRYYLPGNSAGWVFDFGDPRGCYFLEVLQHVDTFITNSRLDLVVRTAALAPTLEDCAGLFAAGAFVDAVNLSTAARPDVERPGWIEVEFNEQAEIGAAVRTVRWPEYRESGHMVTASQPDELLADVTDFLAATGLDSPP